MLRAIFQYRKCFGLRAVRVCNRTRARSPRMGRPARQALALVLMLALPGGAQKLSSGSEPSFMQPVGQRAGGPIAETGNGDPVEQEKRLRALNAERQKSLVADTNKLLKLARELADEVDHTNPDTFTPAQLRKVADIEKLAHSIKDKMSTSVRGTPDFRPAFPAPSR